MWNCVGHKGGGAPKERKCFFLMLLHPFAHCGGMMLHVADQPSWQSLLNLPCASNIYSYLANSSLKPDFHRPTITQFKLFEQMQTPLFKLILQTPHSTLGCRKFRANSWRIESIRKLQLAPSNLKPSCCIPIQRKMKSIDKGHRKVGFWATRKA